MKKLRDNEIKLSTEELNGEGQNTANKINGKSEEQYRITISKSAENALSQILERVHFNFLGGRVTKPEMASWIISKFEQVFDDEMLREVRSTFVDEVSMLEQLLKQVKESGDIPTDLRSLLLRQYGLDEMSKKNVKKVTKNRADAPPSLESHE